MTDSIPPKRKPGRPRGSKDAAPRDKKCGGRTQHYGEPTQRVSFRVPVSHIEHVKRMVADYLAALRKNKE